MSALLDLAARCEAAKGPDRKLEGAICLAVRGLGAESPYWQGVVRNPVPNYTGSLDAAMTLVPEGAGYNLDRYWIREGARWRVEISTGGIPEQPRQVFDCWDACNGALATVAAALRARAAQAGEA